MPIYRLESHELELRRELSAATTATTEEGNSINSAETCFAPNTMTPKKNINGLKKNSSFAKSLSRMASQTMRKVNNKENDATKDDDDEMIGMIGRVGSDENRKSARRVFRKRREKSTALLVAIVLTFALCHVYRLAVQVST